MLVRWNCGWHATLHLWPCGVWGVRGAWRVGIHDVFSLESYWIPAILLKKCKFFQPQIMEVQKSCVNFFLLDMIQNLLGSEPGFCLDVIFVAPCNILQSDIRRPEVRIHEAYRKQWCMGDWYLEAVWKPRSLEPSKLMIVDARSEKFREMGKLGFHTSHLSLDLSFDFIPSFQLRGFQFCASICISNLLPGQKKAGNMNENPSPQIGILQNWMI